MLFVFLSVASCGRERDVMRPEQGDDAMSYVRMFENVMDSTAEYDAHHLDRIDRVRKELKENVTDAERYSLNRTMSELFDSFVCDSAIRYCDENIRLAKTMGDSSRVEASRLNKALLLARAGLFHEALSLQDSIALRRLPDELHGAYYRNYSNAYQYLSEYTSGTPFEARYARLSHVYGDSALAVEPAKSFIARSLRADRLIVSDSLKEAKAYIDVALRDYRSGEREYSVMASIMAYYFARVEQPDSMMKYLALSAISDVRGSIKENMAQRQLAEMLYERGDVKGANKLLKKSMADASYFAARMRSKQSSAMLPLVDSTYQEMQKAARHRVSIFIWVVCVLVVALVVAIIWVALSSRRLRRSNRRLEDARRELHALNGSIVLANEELSDANESLLVSNRIKQEYITRFMELSSGYISSLESYRRTLLRLYRGGRLEEMRRRLESKDAETEALKEFYETFDRAFLHIFPSFVTQFNALLRSDQQVESRDGVLTTGLRIHALIRIGLTDSSQIAALLRCSLTTVYTYRSRIRSAALDPSEFERNVLKIS